MRRGCIIVVDDDPDTRQMLRLALETAGHRVIEAQSGIRLVSALEVDHPDLVLLDANLSFTDGLALCRAVTGNPAFGGIQVVFLSARRAPGDVARGLAAGAVDYFPKPVSLGPLLARIDQLLDGDAPAREAS